MAIDYDAGDFNEIDTANYITSKGGCVSGKIWSDLILSYDKSRGRERTRYYTRPAGGLPSGTAV